MSTMSNGGIAELLSKQASFICMHKYENELETMRQLQKLPPAIQEKRRELYMDWINELEKPIKSMQSEEASLALREEGNKFFTKKQRDLSDLLTACQLYTQAIFKAPPPPPVTGGTSETLALAYANRAMALQEFGYFSQAYDDCECALEYGYPQQNLHKIITRQAFCALQLKDLQRLRRHLAALDTMTLNTNFKLQLEKMKRGCELLNENPPSQQLSNDELDMELDMETQEIVKSNESRGRYMVAANDIKSGEVIFSERSPAFVNVGDNIICQQCCSLLLVPYPCPFCNLQTVYCSIKCRLLHATIHANECMAQQRDLFRHVGIAHLALRMVTTGLPQVMPFLAQQENDVDIWQALNAKDQGGALQLLPIPYMSSLCMISHLGKMSSDDILWFALVSELLVIYLQEFTVFFDVLKDVKAPKTDWELITAALILRHIGQLIVNAHTSVSLVPQRAGMPYDPLYLPLFDSSIWLRPQRVKLGCLHKFSDYEEIAAINFPYLSICNHACEPTFQPRFSGAYVTAYANRHIAKGEEIFNCYTMDFRKTKKSMREKALKDVYRFECECEKCKRENPDEDYQQFHRYRCENDSCRKVFVPDLPNLHTLNWWDSVEGLPPGQFIKCTFCGCPQRCNWFTQFNELLKTDAVATDRETLFACFDRLNDWLLDYHELKLMSAFQLVSDCFAAHSAGSPLTDAEFNKLSEVLKFYLAGIAAQTQRNSIEYVVKMTFLWDFIALGKCVCSKHEMDEMLQSIEIISQEFKMIFVNYYEDYLKHVIK